MSITLPSTETPQLTDGGSHEIQMDRRPAGALPVLWTVRRGFCRRGELRGLRRYQQNHRGRHSDVSERRGPLRHCHERQRRGRHGHHGLARAQGAGAAQADLRGGRGAERGEARHGPLQRGREHRPLHLRLQRQIPRLRLASPDLYRGRDRGGEVPDLYGRRHCRAEGAGEAGHRRPAQARLERGHPLGRGPALLHLRRKPLRTRRRQDLPERRSLRPGAEQQRQDHLARPVPRRRRSNQVLQ